MDARQVFMDEIRKIAGDKPTFFAKKQEKKGEDKGEEKGEKKEDKGEKKEKEGEEKRGKSSFKDFIAKMKGGKE